MADQIYLSSDGISKRNLNQACDALRDAARKLQSASAGMGKYYAVPHIADSWRIFDIGAAGEASKMAQETSRLADRLEEFNDYLPRAQGKLHDVDERYHENVLEKAWNKVKSKNAVWLGLVAGSPAVAIFGALFGGGKQRTGSWVITTAEATEKKVETVDDYRYLLDEFDWSNTTATEEERLAVIAAAMTAAGVKNTESAVRQGLQELYDERYHVSYHTYKDGVKPGSIRYVYQLGDYANNGWVYETDYDCYDYSGIASGECGYASQSMALSYIGIDMPPRELCYREYALGKGGTNYASNYDIPQVNVVAGSGFYTDNNQVNTMVDNFVNNAYTGNTSPVVIHYHDPNSWTTDSNGSGYYGTQHAIVIIGKNSDGYIALDPAKGMQEVRLTIDPDGKVGGDVTYSGSCTLDFVQQFERNE